MNCINVFLSQVKKKPNHPALLLGNKMVTFQELDQLSSERATLYVQQGLQTGHRVLVLKPVDIDLYVTLLALVKMGAVAVFPDASSPLPSLKPICEALSPEALIGTFWTEKLRWVISALRAIPLVLREKPSALFDENIVKDLPPEHPALITFTSGSTGSPKGIVRSHIFLQIQNESVLNLLKSQGEDIDLISLPVFILSNLSAGITTVIPTGSLKKPACVNPRKLKQQIKTHCVTRLLLPPAICQRLADNTMPCPTLKKIFTGGGPVFPDLLKKLKVFAPQAETIVLYGSTEAEPIASISDSEISAEDFTLMETGKGLLVGKLAPEITLRLVDEEIWVAGDHVVKGYLNPQDDASTKVLQDGVLWHRTGDAGYLDDKDRLWLLGRHASRQQTAEGTIHPFCVESIARLLPSVKRAAFLSTGEKHFLCLETRKPLEAIPLRPLQELYPQLTFLKLKSIPLDRRHNSKIDYPRLRKRLSP